jgi:hypothetical protein
MQGECVRPSLRPELFVYFVQAVGLDIDSLTFRHIVEMQLAVRFLDDIFWIRNVGSTCQ